MPRLGDERHAFDRSSTSEAAIQRPSLRSRRFPNRTRSQRHPIAARPARRTTEATGRGSEHSARRRDLIISSQFGLDRHARLDPLHDDADPFRPSSGTTSRPIPALPAHQLGGAEGENPVRWLVHTDDQRIIAVRDPRLPQIGDNRRDDSPPRVFGDVASLPSLARDTGLHSASAVVRPRGSRTGRNPSAPARVGVSSRPSPLIARMIPEHGIAKHVLALQCRREHRVSRRAA